MKELNQVLVLEGYKIRLYDITDFDIHVADNLTAYKNIFFSGDKNSLSSFVGIELLDEDDVLISSCLIASEGGKTGLYDDSTLLSYGGIVVCCSGTVFKLTIPELDLEWKTKADSATCFGIYYLNEDYVVHGELEITRLNKNGQIVWQKSARDIWTTAEGVDDFAIYDGYILATDWQYFRYKFDFDGNLLEEYKVEPNRNFQTTQQEPKKQWWKFWK